MTIDTNNRNILEYLYIVSQCVPELHGAVNEESVRYALSVLLSGRYRMDRDHRLMAVHLFDLYGFHAEAQALRASLKEYLVFDEAGIHWNYPSNGFVSAEKKMEQHIWLMDALLDDGKSSEDFRNGLCQWLLMQKQTQAWRTPQISAEAVYALLRYQGAILEDEKGSDRLCITDSDGKEMEEWRIDMGLASSRDAFVVQMKDEELQNKATSLKVQRTKASGTSWGCVSVQYNLPIQTVLAAGSGMSVRAEIQKNTWYSGDKTRLRYVVTADRDYDYVRLKGVRSSCMEPADAVSGMCYENGLSYYKEVKDSETYYYFERLPKGTFVIEEDVYVEREGDFTTGVPTITEVYAPEFGGYGTALKLKVKAK